MTITEELFQYFCSTASSPIEYGVLDMLQSQIDAAKGQLMALAGTAAYEDIADIAVADIDPTDGDQALTLAAHAFVCRQAFYDAIPQLDLTLSPTGFGIVNSNNVAPASAERVERLRRQVKAAADDALDSFVDALRGNAKWCETPMAKRWFSTLVWRGSQLVAFGYAEPHRLDLLGIKSKIALAEIELQNVIGQDLHAELCDSVRHADTTSAQQIAIDLAVGFLSAKVGGIERESSLAKRALLMGLDEMIDHFECYRNSTAYEANHFKPYANEKEDPCYFFG